jgi:hemophore-related protein
MMAAPTASATGPCTASGLATTASGVLASAGGYLDGHPGANDVLTAAGTQPPDEAKAAVRGYFLAHPGEFVDLQGIVAPLKDLRNQCGVSVTPSQLATLFDTLS